MRIQWTPEAYADRQNIAEHIAQDNPVAALALDDLIVSKALHLIDNPMLGRSGRYVGSREWVINKNYLIVYELHDEHVIVILRVLHAAQQWPSLSDLDR